MKIYRNYIKIFSDRLLAIALIIFFIPIFIIIYLLIFLIDGKPVFFLQMRVGKNFSCFKMIKFRTMRVNNSKKKLTSFKDERVTRIGFFLRKYKLDELPQLFNVLSGDMSLVGPRPEIKEYIKYYNKISINKILSVHPGITDYASIFFSSEENYFRGKKNIISVYKNRIIPIKENYYLKYVDEISFITDLKILFLTIKKIL